MMVHYKLADFNRVRFQLNILFVENYPYVINYITHNLVSEVEVFLE